jgi:cell division protein FtsW (lipid II flippase)
MMRPQKQHYQNFSHFLLIGGFVIGFDVVVVTGGVSTWSPTQGYPSIPKQEAERERKE